MALICSSKSSIISFHSQFPSPTAKVSDNRSSSFKLHSPPTANKWIIDDTSHLTRFDRPCDNLEEKLKLYKNVLENVGENSVKGLCMVDAMQRLNIDYHFQEE
ncbi:probable terpene synthase 4, partial [Prosopis cineraria]|uniref:probable terpene synthase 4 n=1 Tax=Prosopis cineraria TaxID=364024 RepID=UPI00240F14DC